MSVGGQSDMNRKCVLLVVLLIVSVFLVGCGGFTAGDNPSKTSGGGKENKIQNNSGKDTKGVSGAKDKKSPTTAPTSEKMIIRVIAKKVTIDDDEKTLADGQTWKEYLEEFFDNVNLEEYEVITDYSYGDYEVVKEIKEALEKLKIDTAQLEDLEK